LVKFNPHELWQLYKAAATTTKLLENFIVKSVIAQKYCMITYQYKMAH